MNSDLEKQIHEVESRLQDLKSKIKEEKLKTSMSNMIFLPFIILLILELLAFVYYGLQITTAGIIIVLATILSLIFTILIRRSSQKSRKITCVNGIIISL